MSNVAYTHITLEKTDYLEWGKDVRIISAAVNATVTHQQLYSLVVKKYNATSAEFLDKEGRFLMLIALPITDKVVQRRRIVRTRPLLDITLGDCRLWFRHEGSLDEEPEEAPEPN